MVANQKKVIVILSDNLAMTNSQDSLQESKHCPLSATQAASFLSQRVLHGDFIYLFIFAQQPGLI